MTWKLKNLNLQWSNKIFSYGMCHLCHILYLVNHYIMRLQARRFLSTTRATVPSPPVCCAASLRTNTTAFSVQFITQGRLCLIVLSFSFCSLATMASWQDINLPPDCTRLSFSNSIAMYLYLHYGPTLHIILTSWITRWPHELISWYTSTYLLRT